MEKVSYNSQKDGVDLNKPYQQNAKSDTRAKFTCYLFTVSIFGTLGGFSYGYDTGVISGALLFIRKEFQLDAFDQEILVSVTIATAMITALATGYLGDRIGRRPCLLIGSFIFTVATVINGVSSSSVMLIIGRGILGIGIGVILMISPVYIAECSPVEYRGPLVTSCTVMMVLGRCVASVVDGAFSYDSTGWRYMLGVTGIPSSIQFISFFFLPETPRWLIRNGKDDMATAILQKVRGKIDVSTDVQQIKETCRQETKLNELQGNELTIKRVMTTPSVRRALIVGVSTSLFQQLSGINTVMYYSGTIIQMSGVRDESMAIWLTAITAFVSLLFTMAGIYLVERVGRRKIILGSMIGVIFSLAVLAVGFQLSDINSPKVTLEEMQPINNTCSTYSICGDCIKSKNCGYCYIEDGNSAINGSCIPKQDNNAVTGRCNSTNLSDDVVWGVTACPSTYFWMCLLGLTLYLITFSPGIGPLPMTINSEIYPLWARSTCMAIGSSTNWLFSLVISLSFLSMAEGVTTYGAYWIFAGVVVVGVIFLYFTLPETKDKTLEEVESLFESPWCVCGNYGSHDITSGPNMK